MESKSGEAWGKLKAGVKRQENEDAGRKCPSEGVSCENSSHMGGMRGSSHYLRVLREN